MTTPAASRAATPSDEQIMDAIRDLAADGGRWPSDWISAVRRGLALAQPASPAPLTDVMVDMVPPATSRDRWMYEQGRLAERDSRTPKAAALASPQVAPAPDRQEIDAALHYVDDFIARCNGDDRGSCESVNVLRRALAAHVQVAPNGPIEQFRALLRAEVDASIDVSGDIARQEASIDEADHLLCKFNELFPEVSNVRA